MIQTISINPHQVKDYTCVTINAQGMLNGFPFLSIDRDSYLVSVEIQSGINFDPAAVTALQWASAVRWRSRLRL